MALLVEASAQGRALIAGPPPTIRAYVGVHMALGLFQAGLGWGGCLVNAVACRGLFTIQLVQVIPRILSAHFNTKMQRPDSAGAVHFHDQVSSQAEPAKACKYALWQRFVR